MVEQTFKHERRYDTITTLGTVRNRPGEKGISMRIACKLSMAVTGVAMVAMVMAGCGSSSTSSSHDNGSTTSLELNWPDGYSYDQSTHRLTTPQVSNQATGAVTVVKITLIISGEGIDTVTIDVPLDTLTAYFYVSPGLRTFSIVVEDNNGQKYTDSQTVYLTAGEPVELSFNITLNSPPIITSLTASATDMNTSAPVTITATAYDPEGDAFTYHWDGGGGTITGSGASVTFFAPRTGEYTVCLTLTDARGATSDPSCVTITVRNMPPEINSVTVSDTAPQVGQTVTATCDAWDPDRDALAYGWSDGAGWTDTGAQVQYTPQAAGGYTLTCTVTDTHGASVSQSVSFTVQAPAQGTTVNINGFSPSVDCLQADIWQVAVGIGDAVTATCQYIAGGFPGSTIGGALTDDKIPTNTYALNRGKFTFNWTANLQVYFLWIGPDQGVGTTAPDIEYTCTITSTGPMTVTLDTDNGGGCQW